MTKKEAIKWLYEHSKCSPFIAWTSSHESGYKCYGCNGEFISECPKWEEPTLKTFPHKRNCEYIKILKILNLRKQKI